MDTWRQDLSLACMGGKGLLYTVPCSLRQTNSIFSLSPSLVKPQPIIHILDPPSLFATVKLHFKVNRMSETGTKWGLPKVRDQAY
jgi:hypothetical protein